MPVPWDSKWFGILQADTYRGLKEGLEGKRVAATTASPRAPGNDRGPRASARSPGVADRWVAENSAEVSTHSGKRHLPRSSSGSNSSGTRIASWPNLSPLIGPGEFGSGEFGSGEFGPGECCSRATSQLC